MTSLTLFTAPKPFTDPHIALIQRNAVRSWTLLPETEVFLVGDETGIAETAQEMGVGHLGNVLRNPEGTPLVSSIFGLARENGHGSLLAYVNADIILMPDFFETAILVAKTQPKFLLVGQRWDLEITRPLDFSTGWPQNLQESARSTGKLHKPVGSDYFIFPRVCYTEIPDFAVGRAGWDNWMIFKARKEGWKTIDATPSIMIIHQNHDYAHLPGGQIHHHLPESEQNKAMAGGKQVTRFTIKDATHEMKDGRLRSKPLTMARFLRWLETAPLLYFGDARMTGRLSKVLRRAQRKGPTGR